MKSGTLFEKEINLNIINRADIEISRIFNCLQIDFSHKDLILEKFLKIHSILRPGMKYRDIERLVPLVIYFYSKFRYLPIDEHELIKVSNITEKEFYNFTLQIFNFMPKYAELTRKPYILNLI